MRKISILCPSRWRAKAARRTAISIQSTAKNPERVEILFYVDSDDDQAPTYKALLEPLGCKVVVGEPMSVSKSWNILAKECSGDLLIMGNDDIRYRTDNWDEMLDKEVEAYPSEIFCMWFDDGVVRRNEIANFGCAFPIISRKWYETLGYFTPGCFRFLYNDTWIADIANRVGCLHPLKSVLAFHHHNIADETAKRARANNSRALDKELFFSDESAILREDAAQMLREVIEEEQRV